MIQSVFIIDLVIFLLVRHLIFHIKNVNWRSRFSNIKSFLILKQLIDAIGSIGHNLKILSTNLVANWNWPISEKMRWSTTKLYNWTVKTRVGKLKVWDTFSWQKEKNSTNFVDHFFDPKLKFVEKIENDRHKSYKL